MLVILLNCVTLGMFHPCEDIDCDSERCKILQVRQLFGFICGIMCFLSHISYFISQMQGRYLIVFPKGLAICDDK